MAGTADVKSALNHGNILVCGRINVLQKLYAMHEVWGILIRCIDFMFLTNHFLQSFLKAIHLIMSLSLLLRQT